MEDTKVTTKVTLQTLASDLLALAEAVEIDPETGDVTGMEELETAQGAFEDKAVAVAIAIRGAEAFAEGLKKYKLDIEKRQKAAERKIERLKAYLTDNMVNTGVNRIDRIEARISLRGSETVVLDDEDIIPQEYKRITWSVSKTALKRAIDDGKQIPGAHVEQRKNVVIK